MTENLIPVNENSILAKAYRAVNGDRQENYGHPLDNFTLIYRLWEPILEADLPGYSKVALCMAQVKVARELHQQKEDNMVDLAGYADCLVRAVEEDERREDEGPPDLDGEDERRDDEFEGFRVGDAVEVRGDAEIECCRHLCGNVKSVNGSFRYPIYVVFADGRCSPLRPDELKNLSHKDPKR